MTDTKANGAGEQKSALPLFYKKPAPLDAKKHAKLGLKDNFGLGFTEGINAVPVNLIEFPQICCVSNSDLYWFIAEIILAF